MSAFHQKPLDFLHWLQSLPEADCHGLDPGAGSFVPRRMFGTYVRHLVNQEMKVPDHRDQLELVRGDVLDIVPGEGGVTLVLDRDRTLRTDRAVLAIGNFPPAPPPVDDPAEPRRRHLAPAVRGGSGHAGHVLGDDRGARHPPAGRVPGRSTGGAVPAASRLAPTGPAAPAC